MFWAHEVHAPAPPRTVHSGSGEFFMTERPIDLSSLPSYQRPRRSLFSARKLALMASVVAGLGVAIYGFSPPTGPVDIFSSPAHAQVNNEVRKVDKPVGFADIVERVKPSVISVKVNITQKLAKDDSGDDDSPFQPGSPMERFFRRFGGPDALPRMPHGQGVVTGQGSGFFISADGYAVTNNHVVDGADKVEVTTDDGKTYTAKVIGTDARTDLALIKVEGGSNFSFAKLSDGKPRIGDWVLAVGNPFGLGGTVTAGIVSASGRDIGNGPYDDFIQIDAPVNKGNSGGPAFDVQGEAMRVNTALYSPPGGSLRIRSPIPPSTVKNASAQHKAQEKVINLTLGQLPNTVEAKAEPDNDKGSTPKGVDVPTLGLTVAPANSVAGAGKEGVVVPEVDPTSAAAERGFKEGDVILEVGGKTVANAGDVREALNAARTDNKNSVLMRVKSGGSSRFVAVPLAKG